MTGMAAGIKTGYPIYEASSKAGGICGSYKQDGFTFACGGGHWLFKDGPGLDFIKTLVSLNEYERRAGVYYNHTFPYPFQSTARKEIKLDGRIDWTQETLKEWLLNKFGPEQFNLFFGPFNEKYTAGLYDKTIQVDDYKSPNPGGKGFCSNFWDPKKGITELVEKMSAKCDIKYNRRVKGINLESKTLHFEDGKTVEYNKLISTIPLNTLLWICGKQTESNRLPYTSVLVLNIGAKKGKNCPTEHWMYVPFCKSGFYRVGFYSNINPKYSPGDGQVGLSVEMAFLPNQEIDIEKLTGEIVAELNSWGWIDRVITLDPTVVKCAYTWLYNTDDRDKPLEYLKSKDIFSIGRYGAWVFQGMVESIQEGLTVDV